MPTSRYSPSYQTDVTKADALSTDAATGSTSINAGASSNAVITPPRTLNTGDDQYKILDAPDDEVVSAILAGVTKVRRRVEIYEADGTTIWGPSITPRAKTGGVQVSRDNDSRRTLDLTLDNSDKLISHNPDGGLWYDKIIKVFRGVEFEPVRKTPHICVIAGDATTTPNARSYLGALGFSDITFLSNPTTSQVKNYDIVVAWKVDANFDTGTANLLTAACYAGVNVLTLCNYADQTTVPLIASVTSKGTTAARAVTVTTADTPFVAALDPYNTAAATVGEKNIATKASDTRIAANSSADGPTALYREINTGCRWFHYQGKLIGSAGAPTTDLVNQNIFLQSAVNWLFDYKPLGMYEVQVGEFMIDTIREPRFPHEITITGRDYSKKLELDKFEYTTTFSAGLNVGDVLAGIATNAGIKKLNVNDNNQVLKADFTADRGMTRLDAIKQLAQAYKLDWFFDMFGVFVVTSFVDPATSPTALTLKTGGTDGNLVEYSKSSDDTEMYNVVIAEGLSGSGQDSVVKYQYIAENNDPNSPTRISRVGRRVMDPISNSAFKSQDQVESVAKAWLAVKSLEAFELSFDMLVFPWIDVDRILEFVDPDSEDTFPTRFLLTDISFPMELGPATGTGKRLALVADTNVDSTA